MATSSVRLWTALPGTLLIAATLYEVFNDLFHPASNGCLSDWVGRAVFSLFRRWKTILPAAGPLTLVIVIGLWTMLLSTGFALVYWSDAPEGIRPGNEDTFGSCLYFSMEALTTLGLGEIRPRNGLLRTLVPVESMIGLAVVTASVSWIVLLYPALARMRCLARRAFIVHDAQKATGIDIAHAGAEPLLDEVIVALIRTRIDFVHYPLIYYFYAYDDRGSLPGALRCLSSLAEDAARNSETDCVRLRGAALRIALDEFAGLLSDRFMKAHGDDGREAVFDFYRNEHLVSK